MTPQESKAQLRLLTDDAADTATWVLRRSSGSFESRRVQILESGSAVVGYYSEGSAALAADFYDDARSTVGAGRFTASAIVLDRVVKTRRGIVWAVEPLAADDEATAADRLSQVVRSEVMAPYRDTIVGNSRRDPASVGWRRVTSAGTCGFCAMLAGRGAVYREATARFAAHTSCRCTAAPVFRGGEVGPEASVLQYVASRRRQTPKQRQQVRDYIASFHPHEADRKHVAS